ncbi:PREDICTED: early growth response protein 3 [Charadrius vociferus]|uniref:early growth response protein 3 n=1 Tax=Charadrius vociferus TaxID=50402 RepID=UPI0005212AA4|nr:PREDICTED: early growth response protein 3 [Charadrius vociferus]
MDIGLANEKAGQELSSYSGTFQPAPGNKTVTYLGKFAFDSPSNWCQDNIISLMSAGILGVPGALPSTQSSAGSMGPPQGEVDQMYPALPPYSSCSDLYPEPVSFHDPQSNPGLTYSPQDYQAAKPALDSNLFPMIPDYNLYHHPNDMGTITEHKPFQSLDPIRVNPPPITPLETIKAFKDKQIHPGRRAETSWPGRWVTPKATGSVLVSPPFPTCLGTERAPKCQRQSFGVSWLRLRVNARGSYPAACRRHNRSQFSLAS